MVCWNHILTEISTSTSARRRFTSTDTKKTEKFVSSLLKNKARVWDQELLIAAKWERKHGLVQLKHFPAILRNHANTSGKRCDQKPLVQSRRGRHRSTKNPEYFSFHPTWATVWHWQEDSAGSFPLRPWCSLSGSPRSTRRGTALGYGLSADCSRRKPWGFSKLLDGAVVSISRGKNLPFCSGLLSLLPFLRCVCLSLTSPFWLK